MKKKIITLALIGVLAVTAVVGASLAYFTDTESEGTEFTVGDVEIALETTTEGLENMVPGEPATFTANVTNTGTVEAYLRLAVTVSDQVELSAVYSGGKEVNFKYKTTENEDGTNTYFIYHNL